MYTARAFVYAPSLPPMRAGFLSFAQPGPPYRFISLGQTEQGLLFHRIALPAPDSAFFVSTQAMPLGRWVCLELRVVFGIAGSGSAKVFMDDVEVADVAYNGGTIDSPPLSVASSGVYFDAPSLPAYDFWLDELVIGSQPIGCAK